MFRVATLVFAVLVLPAAALAQEPPPPPPPSEAQPPAASERTLTGVITETGGDPVQGAVILVRGRDVSAVTEADGRFSIPGIPAGPVTLDVMGPAHTPKEVQVGPAQTSVSVVITAVVTEVVLTERAPVIAKQNLANGASVVRAEDLNRVSAQTIEGAMQAKVAGANIQSNSGAPGGGLQVRLRGVSTINGQTDAAVRDRRRHRQQRGHPLRHLRGDPVQRAAPTRLHPGQPGQPHRRPQPQRHREHRGPQGRLRRRPLRLQGRQRRGHHHHQARPRRRRAAGGLTQRFGIYQLSNKLGSRTLQLPSTRRWRAFGERRPASTTSRAAPSTTRRSWPAAARFVQRDGGQRERRHREHALLRLGR